MSDMKQSSRIKMLCDRGASALEYVGAVIVAAVVVGAVLAGIQSFDLKKAITDSLTTITNGQAGGGDGDGDGGGDGT